MFTTLYIPGANKSSSAEREGMPEHNAEVVRYIVKNIPQQYLFQDLESFNFARQCKEKN